MFYTRTSCLHIIIYNLMSSLYFSTKSFMELLSKNVLFHLPHRSMSRLASAKVRTIFITTKYFCIFFRAQICPVPQKRSLSGLLPGSCGAGDFFRLSRQRGLQKWGEKGKRTKISDEISDFCAVEHNTGERKAKRGKREEGGPGEENRRPQGNKEEEEQEGERRTRRGRKD